MFRALLIAVCILGMHVPLRPRTSSYDGDFVGPGIYSPTTGCKKLEAIEKGDAAPNIATYPLKLTREGTRGWEGGCDFTVDPQGEAEHLRSQHAVFRRRG